MATWTEDLHPREPHGPKGGQFAHKPGQGEQTRGGWLLDAADLSEISKYRTSSAVEAKPKPLSAAYTKLVRGYLGSTRQEQIDKALRSGGEIGPQNEATIRALDHLTKVRKLHDDVLLYREATQELLSSLSLKPGDLMTSPSFTHVTMSPNVSSPGHYVIEAPQGAPALTVPTDLGFHDEVILPRHAMLEYVGEQGGEHVFRYKVEVAPEVKQRVKAARVDQPPVGNLTRAEVSYARDYVRGRFPNVKKSNFVITNDETSYYNCIGRAFGDTSRNWWPDYTGEAFWPEDVRGGDIDEGDVASFDDLLIRKLGGEQIWLDGEALPDNVRQPEAGFVKLALFTRPKLSSKAEREALGPEAFEHPTHMAVQEEDGKWVSKLGSKFEIRHDKPEDVEGDDYGKFHKLYKLPIAKWQSMKSIGRSRKGAERTGADVREYLDEAARLKRKAA